MQRDQQRSGRRQRNAADATLEPLGPWLAAAADLECRRIARALADTRHRHHGIHRARKAIRTLRAQLGLLKAALDRPGREHLRQIDGRLKRLCRSLSPLRDAHVAAVTAGTLRGTASPAKASSLEAVLVAVRDRATEQALQQDPAFRHRRETIGALRTDIAALPWATLDARAARRAIRRSRHRVARAEHKARHTPTSLLRHRWRRRLRRLRLQLETFETAQAGGTGSKSTTSSERHTLKRQTDRLGRLQDVQLMCRLARRIAPVRDDPELRALLAAAMREARAGFAEGLR